MVVGALGRRWWFVRALAYWRVSGKTPPMRAANQACGEMVISARPAATAWKILLAAYLVLTERPGVLAAKVNQRRSNSTSPTMLTWSSPPVRMRPGQTVVTRMPLWRSSAWRPSEKPTKANFAALYGSRCGTAILPPMLAMLTIAARRVPESGVCLRRCGRAAQVV